MMRKARVFVHGIAAGVLEQLDHGYRFSYQPDYQGPPVSLTMPIKKAVYEFEQFPPFVDHE